MNAISPAALQVTVRRFALAALLVLVAPAVAVTAAEPVPSSSAANVVPDTTTVILLGTGISVPDPKAQGPATAVFDGASKGFLDQVERVVRLIRSKGVGVWFVTQSPKDVPANVLGQLGNRVQHALPVPRAGEGTRPRAPRPRAAR